METAEHESDHRQTDKRFGGGKYALSIPPKATLLEWTEGLRTFDRPAFVVWTPEDRQTAAVHGRRLAELLPKGRLVEIRDSYTLIPEDQPQALADAIREFVCDTA